MRSEREEDAFQAMFDAIKAQSIHAAPVKQDDQQTQPAEPASGPDGKPAGAAPAMHMTVAPRARAFDDSQQKIVQGRLWLISFTDLFSIVLCFFLLIYSTKDPDMDKISKMTGSSSSGLHGGSGKKEHGEAGGDQPGASIARVEYGEALNLDYLQGVLKTALNQVHLQDDVDITNGRDHLKLEVDDPFRTDTSLDDDGGRIAKGLADRLGNLSNRITVVAHGDDWQQVMARSGTFADAMREAGYRKPFTVIGELTGGPDIEIRVEADDGRLQ